MSFFDFVHFICTRLDVAVPSAPKAGPPAVANFTRKKIFHIKGTLRMESFMFRGQGVPELHVRTDTQSNFVPKSISIFESQIHRCFLDLHTTEQCIHSTNEKLLFKTT